MKKYTLIFDGNYFLHKTLHIASRIKDTGELNFIDDPDADKNILLWKLSTDFSFETRKFSSIIDRVVYCIDSRSWRKDFYPESNYKGNREHDSSIDWTKVYAVHDEFIKGIEKFDVIISRIDGTEADDLIFGWSSILNQNKSNAVILSGDNDLIQLVNYDKVNDTNTIYYNKFSNKLYVFPHFEKWMVERTTPGAFDFFSQPIEINSGEKDSLAKIIKSYNLQKEMIKNEEFIFIKILVGDNGDNVTSLYEYQKPVASGPNAGKIRIFRVSDLQANKIMEMFKTKHGGIRQSHFFDDIYIDDICQFAIDTIKIANKTKAEIIKKYKENRDLVYLHNNCIPEGISKVMYKSIEESLKYRMSDMKMDKLKDKENLLKILPYDDNRRQEQNSANFFKNLGI